MPVSVSKRGYIFYGVPELKPSAGCRVLYMLRKELELRGYEAKIYQKHGKYKKALSEDCYVRNITDEMRENWVVVYPEVVWGNPLGFRNAVRYVLYFPGILGGQTNYHEGELVFSWDAVYLDNVPLLKFPLIDSNIFYDSHEERDVDCFWVHKGKKYYEIQEVENVFEITMKWPATQLELADLLRKTKTLYSYDANSSLLDEAYFCGAQVKIVRENCLEDYVCGYDFKKDVFEEQMQNFILLTQQMNYQGAINTEGQYSAIKRFGLKMYASLLSILYGITKYKAFQVKRKAIKNKLL